MTVKEMGLLFEKYEDEFLKFNRILPEDKLSSRKDISAFILLNALVPGTADIVSAAEHDEFFLDVTPEALAHAATEQDIITLIRCGVRYDTSTDSLAMFA